MYVSYVINIIVINFIVYTWLSAFTAFKKPQEIGRDLEIGWRISEESRLEREENQADKEWWSKWVMTMLISWSWITKNLISKKIEENEKKRHSEEELDWYTMGQ